MSAFLGIIGSNPSLLEKVAAVIPNASVSFQSNDLSLFGEGKPDRFFSSISEANKTGWIVSGVALESQSPFRPLNSESWSHQIKQSKESVFALNGHFVAMRFTPQQIEFYTDSVGIRSLFLARWKTNLIFSTRFDWLLKILPEKSFDWSALGSWWSSINSFTGQSIIQEIRRIKSSGYVSIEGDDIEVKTKPWRPFKKEATQETTINELLEISSSFSQHSEPISIGLSGGLDSRVLLALMMHQPKSDFDIYTFTNRNHPDEGVARLLGNKTGKPHRFQEFEELTVDQILHALPEVSSRSMLSASISQLSQIATYEKLGHFTPQTIDGGLGEIGRRRYLRSVEMNGGNALKENNPRRLLPYFIDVKANIFKKEIRELMETGVQDDLAETMSYMPSVNEIGIDNWLDLFSIRTRIVNLGGIQQDIIDEKILHLMPFIQPVFLNSILNLPPNSRKNAKLYRSIIQRFAPQLTRVPLVKGDDTYPYRLKDLSAMAWMKAKRKIGIGYVNSEGSELMFDLEEYVRDTFTESFLSQSNCYSQKKVLRLIDGFYKEKNLSKASAINWLITFESFRKQV